MYKSRLSRENGNYVATIAEASLSLKSPSQVTTFYHPRTMKSIVPALLFSTLAVATPTRRSTTDTSTDVDDVIAGRKPCASSAVVFGRGTFDSGNIGVWTGPQFKEALVEELDGDVHFQGVNREKYPANLDGYAREGGSESCADACAELVEGYAEKCAEAKIFVSGWRFVAMHIYYRFFTQDSLTNHSQGALCAHKCVNRVKTSQLAGLVVFGSENDLMDNPSPIPANLPYAPYCNEDNAAPDLLCTETWTSGIDLPDSPSELTSMIQSSLSSLKSIAKNEEQRRAALQLPLDMAAGIVKNAGYIAKDILQGKVRKWLVLLPHFEYATKGYTDEAAVWVAGQVKGQ